MRLFLLKRFDEVGNILGYHVVLDEDGDLEWVTMEDGKEVRFDKEPETGFWKRFGVGFMSIFVPESQL